jgi:hypothetical protein
MNLNRSSGILQHEAGEEKKIRVGQADLELEGLHQIEDGRSGDKKAITILRERAIGQMTDAGNLIGKN